jgi:two-component system, chemotaxis family, sensor kinase Cph1
MTAEINQPVKDKAERPVERSSYSNEIEGRKKKSENILSESNDQSTKSLVHELQVHQIELEMQAEELRRAHLLLEESRDRYLDLYEFAPLGYVTLTDKGMVVEANLTSASLLNIERSKLLKARFSKFIGTKDNDVWYRYFTKLLSQKEGQTCSLTLMRGDGSEFPARLESIQIVELSESKPKIRMAISDITDLEQVTEALSKSGRQYHKLVESANEAILVLQSGTPRFVNSSMLALTGFSEQDLLSIPFIEMIHPDDASAVADHLRIMSTGEVSPDRCVFRIFGNGGSIRWVEMNAITTDWEERPAILCFMSDITERKNMEEELRRSNIELQQFAYVASHDLQEPIRMVVSYLTLLEKKYQNMLDPEAQAFIHFAVDGGKRMRLLIDDLLNYSRVDMKGKDFVPVDMNEVVQKTLNNLSVFIDENKADISVGLMPTILADESQMIQVMQNLISNAVKFHGQEAPKITVSALKGPEGWTFAVKDNGIGLRMEYSDKIFLMFQRLNTGDAYPGTGVGLAVVKKIVNRHGGQIWVESKEGNGSAFFFSIPEKRKTERLSRQGIDRPGGSS